MDVCGCSMGGEVGVCVRRCGLHAHINAGRDVDVLSLVYFLNFFFWELFL